LTSPHLFLPPLAGTCSARAWNPPSATPAFWSSSRWRSYYLPDPPPFRRTTLWPPPVQSTCEALHNNALRGLQPALTLVHCVLAQLLCFSSPPIRAAPWWGLRAPPPNRSSTRFCCYPAKLFLESPIFQRPFPPLPSSPPAQCYFLFLLSPQYYSALLAPLIFFPKQQYSFFFLPFPTEKEIKSPAPLLAVPLSVRALHNSIFPPVRSGTRSTPPPPHHSFSATETAPFPPLPPPEKAPYVFLNGVCQTYSH